MVHDCVRLLVPASRRHCRIGVQVPFKQWLRKEFDVRRVVEVPDKSHRLMAGDGDL